MGTHGLLGELLSEDRNETIEDARRSQEQADCFVFVASHVVHDINQIETQVLLNANVNLFILDEVLLYIAVAKSSDAPHPQTGQATCATLR